MTNLGKEGMIKIYLKYLIALLFFCLTTVINAKNDKDFTVVIDAGHGGKDIGATDNGVKEKDINLKVAQYLENLIKKKMKDTKVVMTRDNDSYLTLQQRADIANKSHGDLFISIHTNSVDKRNKNRKNISGSSVYTLGLHKDENNLEVAMRENSVIELENDYAQKYSGFDPQKDESYIIFEMAQKQNLAQSIRFAENVENELTNAGREARGVHQAGFWVLWATSMPSVLIELDFICNPVSAKYLSSDKGAKELAEAIFNAVKKYENSWKKLMGKEESPKLPDTYQSDEISILEDSYVVSTSTPVAVAKTRTHLPSNVARTGNNTSAKRKRRSNSSRILSMNKDYEKNNLSFPDLSLAANGGRSFDDKLSEMISTGHETVTEEQNNSKKKSKEKKKQKVKAPKEDKKSKKRKEDAHNAKVNKLVTVYKIQILASTDLLSQGDSKFCGLSPVTAYKEHNLYKYYYGESTNREEVQSLLTDVKKRIPDAFIVASKKSIQSK